MKSTEVVLVLALGISALACSGGSSNPGASVGGECPAFTPCGGNVVGTWRLKSVCIKNTPTDAATACSVQTTGATTMGPGYSATYTFNSNGTFTGAISGSVQQTLSYPGVACSRSDAGAEQYCADIQQSVQGAYAAAADAGTVTPIKSLSFACTPSGSEVCQCEETFTYTPYTIDGTYTTSGDTFTVVMTGVSILGDGGVGDGGTGSPIAYCVSGNTLTWGPAPGSADEGDGVIVFTK
jgi:hypothetical protein